MERGGLYHTTRGKRDFPTRFVGTGGGGERGLSDRSADKQVWYHVVPGHRIQSAASSHPRWESHGRGKEGKEGSGKRIRWNEDDACSANPPPESRAYQGHRGRVTRLSVNRGGEILTLRLASREPISSTSREISRIFLLETHFRVHPLIRTCWSKLFVWNHRESMCTSVTMNFIRKTNHK